MNKITLIGYGKMGKEIERIIQSKEFSGELIIEKIVKSSDSLNDCKGETCIDFTTPDAFVKNHKTLSKNFKNIVIGTTGWEKQRKEILNYFIENKNNVIYGSNFSIGVNIFFLINEFASKCFKDFNEYSVYISEKHHKEKKDKPSGTALSINELISRYKKVDDINSIRSGKIKGIHEVEFVSEYDSVKLEHTAYSREGFAAGSLLAAKMINSLNGVYEFRELIKNKILNNV